MQELLLFFACLIVSTSQIDLTTSSISLFFVFFKCFQFIYLFTYSFIHKLVILLNHNMTSIQIRRFRQSGK
jgi:hypothetical protein